MSQKTIAQLKTDSNNTYTDNTAGDIAPSGVRTLNTDWLDSVKPLEVIVSANKTAILGESYVVVATATFTDPTPVEGKGYTVFVRNGTATVGGVAYDSAGTTITRIFHSGAWKNYTTGLSGNWTPTFTGFTTASDIVSSFMDLGSRVAFNLQFDANIAEPLNGQITVPDFLPMATGANIVCQGVWVNRYNSDAGVINAYVDSDGSGKIQLNIISIENPTDCEFSIVGSYKKA